MENDDDDDRVWFDSFTIKQDGIWTHCNEQ
jgi:hypothetical protein